jgi:GTPase SAR1 family protein
MDILIMGKSGFGKSNLADRIQNAIFKADKDASITTNDPDRETKVFGHGKNSYGIHITKEYPLEGLDKFDVVVDIRSPKFKEIFDSLNT